MVIYNKGFHAIVSDAVLNRIIDLTLLVPVYWVFYALPHSFTIPTTRILLPFPLPDNTAQATTVLLISITYIFCSLRLRRLPPLYRLSLPINLILLSITSYEFIHTILYKLFHNLPHGIWDIQQLFLLSSELLFLFALKLFLQNYNISTISPNTITFTLVSSFFILTLYQWQRGFYIYISDDLTAILHKTLAFFTYSSLLIRRSQT